MATRISGNRTSPVVPEKAPLEPARPVAASEKKPTGGWSAKPASGAPAARPSEGGRDFVPLSQHGNTFVIGAPPANQVGMATHAVATKVWNGVFTQLRPTQVAADAAKFGGIIDGGKAVFDISKGSAENVLRLEATGTNGKATAIVRASTTDEARNELWITFAPTKASALQQLEVVTTNGEPLKFMIGGHQVERGAVMDYVEAHGHLGLGDSPNARAILGAMFKIPDASPLIYRPGTEIARSMLLD